MQAGNQRDKVLRLEGVRYVTGLSRSAIYDKGSASSKYFDPSFPARFKLGERSVGWDALEIDEWVQSKKCERVGLRR
jgi:predicted DNA-binding transcriptional regulator AlpA